MTGGARAVRGGRRPGCDGIALAIALPGATVALSGATVALSGATVAATLPPTTGNLVVMLDRGRASSAATRSAVRAVVARAGGRPAGKSVPEIGLVTVRPRAGANVAAFVRRLRSLVGVASVWPEHRYMPRVVPNDPALTSRSSPSTGPAIASATTTAPERASP